MSRRLRSAAGGTVTLGESLTAAGLEPDLAAILEAMPHRVVEVD